MDARAESISSAGSASERDVEGSDGCGQDVSGNIRANPLTIQWLLEHFERADGVSLPRSTIFTHYLRHCDDKALDAMNPATFGKTIRSVFNGLRSRRLGTRGHSRYHYYGLRIKPQSALADLPGCEESALRAKPGTGKLQRTKPVCRVSAASSHQAGVERQTSTSSSVTGSILQVTGDDLVESMTEPHASRTLPSLLSDDAQWARVDALVTRASVYPITSHDLSMFRQLYRKHCQSIMDALVGLKFAAVEGLWSTFWRARFDEEAEKMLPFDKFYLVIGCNALQDLVIDIDVDFFHSVVNLLIPDVLRPIPGSLTQVIRNFAKSLEGWVRESMARMPRRLVHLKLLAASALAQTLRRYTSLNHLAQAARTVLTNPAQTGTMLADVSRLDMNSIYEQGSLMCACDVVLMRRYSDEFKLLLNQTDASDRWPAWLDKIIHTALDNSDPSSTVHTQSPSQLFCQKWSYFSSLAIRDLTLRSAASFGSFHLIRLLFDEYVVYAVEQRLAKAANICSLRLFLQHLTRLYPFSDGDLLVTGKTAAAAVKVAESDLSLPRRHSRSDDSPLLPPNKRFYAS